MSKPHVQGKPAIRIAAKVLKRLGAATLIDAEGDKVWIPNTTMAINKPGSVDIVEWMYLKKFPNG